MTVCQDFRRAKNADGFCLRSGFGSLANMSHELRPPRNAILGFSAVLKEQYFGPLVIKEDGNYLRLIAIAFKTAVWTFAVILCI